MLGEVGEGFKVAMSALDGGRYSVAAGCVGICQGCLDASVSYAQEREQFGQPIAGFQLVQAMLAEMKVRTDAARLLVQRAGFLRDQGRPCTTETSIAKLYATEAAVWCANEAIQVHGAAGYVDDHPVERWFRDARVTTLYEGTSQIHQLIIGRALTGIDAMTPEDLTNRAPRAFELRERACRPSSASSTPTATTSCASSSPRSGATTPTTPSRRRSSRRCARTSACGPARTCARGS